MKTNRIIALALLVLSTLNPQLSTLFAQGTAFTYQGRFQTNGVPYTGSAEFQFTLWDAASGGSAAATNNKKSISTLAKAYPICTLTTWILSF